jgi:hypothetical protein
MRVIFERHKSTLRISHLAKVILNEFGKVFSRPDLIQRTKPAIAGLVVASTIS